MKLHPFDPGLWDIHTARAYCGGVSEETWRSWDKAGIVPAPLRLGGRVMWNAEEIKTWVKAGCPGRARWEEEKAARAAMGAANAGRKERRAG